MAHIHYSNCFVHKHNSCSWQPEHHIISVWRSTIVFLNFEQIVHVHHEILIFKITRSFPYILYCGGQGCPPQYKMYGKIKTFKVQYLTHDL